MMLPLRPSTRPLAIVVSGDPEYSLLAFPTRHMTMTALTPGAPCLVAAHAEAVTDEMLTSVTVWSGGELQFGGSVLLIVQSAGAPTLRLP
jgi:hypothetical protein